MEQPAAHSVLFVCLGNICRSPMAEAVFNHRVAELGLSDRFVVDSCGTASYHIGESPDPRTLQTCARHGVPINHTVRQLTAKDFDRFDFIFGMDESNISNIASRQPPLRRAVVSLFGIHDPQGQRIIEDPYYGGIEGFEEVFQQAHRCTDGFLKSLRLLSS